MADNRDQSDRREDETRTNDSVSRPFPAAPVLRFRENPPALAVATALSEASAALDMPRTGSRSERAITSSTSRGFLSPREAWSPANDPVRNPRVHFTAPYLDPFRFDTVEIEAYMVNGLLPGNIPGWARFTREYNFRFILPADCFSGRKSRDRDVNRVAYYRLVFKRGSIRDVNRLCPEHLNLDTWILRHPNDLAYAEGLSSVRMPSGDCLTKLFTAKVLCYLRPLLQVNFRFLKRQRHRYGGKLSLIHI